MEELSWAALGALIITTVITLLVHRSLIKHVFTYQKELANFQHQNQVSLEAIRVDYQKALLKVENENSMKIAKMEIENEKLSKKVDREHDVRQKSIVVAELLALWFKTFAKSKSHCELTKDEYKRLNQLSFECGLWLPQSILDELSDRLAGKPGSKDIKEILIDVRYHLNRDSEKVEWEKIIHF